jgi:hypothetical protein
VHAKASTKCPYLTLENPHHQRHHCQKQVKRGQYGLQTISIVSCYIGTPQGGTPDANPRHRSKKPIHNVKKKRRPNAERLRIAAIRRPRQTGCLILVWNVGGAYRDRTDDLKLAKLALSQLS